MQNNKFASWEKSEYLGDGVYISNDGYQMKLMANDHLNPTDTIYLDQSTFQALLQFVKVHAEAWLREE